MQYFICARVKIAVDIAADRTAHTEKSSFREILQQAIKWIQCGFIAQHSTALHSMLTVCVCVRACVLDILWLCASVCKLCMCHFGAHFQRFSGSKIAE